MTLAILLKNNGTNSHRQMDARTRRRHAVSPDAPVKGRYKVLTKEEIKRVRNIRKLYKQGWTQQQIADKYRMGRTTISKIVRGITYHDV